VINWKETIKQGIEIMYSYDTSVTLRQLFYRLVSTGMLPNTRSAYTQLSHKTSEARRDGSFPPFIDKTRSIHQRKTFNNLDEAMEFFPSAYRRGRTEGQPFSLYLGVEKDGIVEQLYSWFGDLGIPILALRGYASQTYKDEVSEHIYNSNRLGVCRR